MPEMSVKPRARALLIAPDTGEYDVEASISELAALADTAGADTVATLTQKRNSPDAATCIGSGLLAEAVLTADNLGVDLVVFDCELSGSQTANLERAFDRHVVDRTTLILDIFAQRARSAEGRLQVELAQLRYRLPRLVGRGIALSRLGGGIGTRGPGETKLETDRRHIRRRIELLQQRLDALGNRRALLRERRKKDEVPVVAIVGYTNVGKSTLLNALTDAGVLSEDRLFATLDPTARTLRLPGGRSVMLIDTVGLVRRLPHTLVEAFASTLEEAAAADLILNVCDISAPDAAQQLAVAQQLLTDIGAQNIPVLHLLNKCDKIDCLPLVLGADTCLVSAKTGFGLGELLRRVDEVLPASQTRLTLLVPYGEGTLAGELRARGRVFSQEYLPEGIRLDLLVDNRMLERCRPYLQPK